MHAPDRDQQLAVANRPGTRWPLQRGLVGLRGELAAVLGEHQADRLDPELTALPVRDRVVAVLVDEPHEPGEGRSSSAAKKADAVFKIAFARRQLTVLRLQLLEPPA